MNKVIKNNYLLSSVSNGPSHFTGSPNATGSSVRMNSASLEYQLIGSQLNGARGRWRARAARTLTTMTEYLHRGVEVTRSLCFGANEPCHVTQSELTVWTLRPLFRLLYQVVLSSLTTSFCQTVSPLALFGSI
ncbi:hypothetical protein J6590_066987 [Homalodisca vitripennis]|nr:hypothetical protein J6590_066987 [Homalodisca vitripennis]